MVSSLAEAALKDGTQTLVVPMPVFEDLFASGPTEAYPRGTRDPTALTMILHSSGTLGMRRIFSVLTICIC